ncbi:MAG: hypothetical protein J6Y13_07675 [Treponema sp.]|nr:hypothetical protein [Treponema sp.]
MRILILLFLGVFVCTGKGVCQSAAAACSIISPVAGTWGNKQPLLIDVPDGFAVYYSISGSDPLLFVFAYDGPSLIDQEGDVHLKITTVDRAGRRSDYSIDYTVTPASRLDPERKWTENQRNFVRMISTNPVRKYTAGSVFSIPAEFSYMTGSSLPGEDSRFFPGGLLSFGRANTVVRSVPFIVTDGETLFRFIVRTAPAQEGAAAVSSQLPFRISGWETVLPLDASYVFKIDDGEWKGKLTALQVDRSETHVLFWKAEGEPDDAMAQTLVLYPKPSLACSVQDDGSCRFSLALAPPYRSAYRLGRSAAAPDAADSVLKIIAPAPGLHESLVMDAFTGEDVTGTFTSGVYLDGVYQGDLSADFHLDRLPPLPPAIIPAERTGLAFTDDREIRIESEVGASVFYAVSEGIPRGDSELGERGELTAELCAGPVGSFTKLTGDRFRLAVVGGQATCYRVAAYAVDAAGNAGERSELQLLVEGRNIYLRTAEAPADGENGSYDAPFRSFEQAAAAINANENLTLHVLGDVSVRTGVTLARPCVITGSRAVLHFLRDASLFIDRTNVVFKNCSILKEDFAEDFTEALAGDAGAASGAGFPAAVAGAGETGRKQTVFISVQDGSLGFEGCDLSARFEQEGKLMELRCSAVSARSSSFSVYASSYSSLFTAYTSQIALTDSVCAVSSYTALAFCMVDSDLRLEKSVASVSCYTGRIAELSGGSCLLRGNILNGALRATGSPGKLAAVRTSGSTTTLALESNTIRGFTE